MRLNEPVVWNSGSGGPVLLGPDLQADLLLELGDRPEEWDPVDPGPIVVGWRLADNQGGLWEARSVVHSAVLTRPLEPEQAETAGIRFWEDAPAAWVDALRDRCVLRGASDLLDGRERFEMSVGPYVVTIMHKYQGPRIDAGLLDSAAGASALVIRCSGLYYDSVVNQEGSVLAELEDQICMAYSLEVEALLPTFSPELHHSDLDGWASGEDGVGVPFVPAR